jgi:phosphate-selective porin OprO/OprP
MLQTIARQLMHRIILLAGAALALSGTATLAQSDPRLPVLEQELRDVRAEIENLKKAQTDSKSDTGSSAALADFKRAAGDQYADINNQLAALPRVGLDNGRLTVASVDGRFTLALRALIQFDTGYFAQGKGPASVDLNSGANFRRAQIGLAGTVWHDWSYNFTYDFGGNGIEKNGYIYYAYLQYDGFGPLHVRGGAITPFAALEDATGSGDLLFLERPSVSDIARNIAGAPGREGMDAFLQGDAYLLSVSYTGKKATDAGTFDEQSAIVTRASWLPVATPEFKWLLDANYTRVLHLPDAAANSNANSFSFSSGPELAVDASKTVNTGNIDAKNVTEFGFETAGSYAGFYAQGGWFGFNVERRLALPNPDFDGWYAVLTYSLTGEEHPYDPATASFRSLRPAHPLGTPGGWGAWELKARYSHIDLDFNPLASATAGGIGGGIQDVWTVGVNWYPTNGIRFALEYDNIKVNHVGAPATDISADAIGLRTQLSL